MPRHSPFPGMDPYLESSWGDVHHRIISGLSDQLAEQLPPGLYATIEQTLYLIDVSETLRHFRPDVAVIENDVSDSARHDVGTTAVAEPGVIQIADDPIEVGSIEIRSLDDDRALVAVIEVLSPANKSNSRGREQYLSKRRAYYEASVSVMELDLLRAEPHTIGVPREVLSDDQYAAYRACVWRDSPDTGSTFEYYPLPLRRRLPRIGLPLRPADARVILDLQSPIDLAYERGRYGNRIDYAAPPKPPLSANDDGWARQLIAGAPAS